MYYFLCVDGPRHADGPIIANLFGEDAILFFKLLIITIIIQENVDEMKASQVGMEQKQDEIKVRQVFVLCMFAKQSILRTL